MGQTVKMTMTKRAYLSDSEMAETTNELGFIEGVGGHFHATHGLHVFVHFEQFVLSYLNFEGRWVAFVGAERVLVKFDGEWLGVVGDGVLQQRGIRRRGDGPRKRRLKRKRMRAA